MGNTVWITVAQNRNLVQILNGSLEEVQMDSRMIANALLGKTVFLVNMEAEKRVTNDTACHGIN